MKPFLFLNLFILNPLGVKSVAFANLFDDRAPSLHLKELVSHGTHFGKQKPKCIGSDPYLLVLETESST